MIIHADRNKVNRFAVILYAAIFLYAISDMKSSANTVVKQLDRSGVHIYLALVIALMGWYVLTHLKGKIMLNPVIIPLWIIIWWIAVCNMICGSSIWIVLVHGGLAVWWLLTIYFASIYVLEFKRALKVLLFAEGLLFLYNVFSTIQASIAFVEYVGTVSVLNMSYNILSFLPLFLLLPNKKLRILTIGIITLLVMVSMKRGAILALPLMLLASSAIQNRMAGRKVLPIGRYLAAGIALVAIFLVADAYSGGFLLSRFSVDELSNGSTRNILYATAWDDIVNRSLLDFIVGKGSGSSIAALSSGVHNEVLEFMFSYGLIGLILYLSLAWGCLKWLRILMKRKSPLAPAFTAACVYFFCVGLWGGVYFTHQTYHIMLVFGISMAKEIPGTLSVRQPAY